MTLTAAWLGLMLVGDPRIGACQSIVLDGGIEVAVSEDQMVTVIGETPSLHGLIEELCRQADVELRAYDAADRRYVGRLEGVAFGDALRSMLRSESYLLGFKAGNDAGSPRITWVRILSTNSADPGRAVAMQQFARPHPSPTGTPKPAAQRFIISSSLLYQAFGTFDPIRRDKAQREIVDRILSPEQLELFLQSEPAELAKLFGRYREPQQTLRRLKSIAGQPEVSAKFDEIIAELERDASKAQPK